MDESFVEVDDAALQAAAHALSVRARLDSLLTEALAAPDMACEQVERLVQFASSGELARTQQQLDELRGRDAR